MAANQIKTEPMSNVDATWLHMEAPNNLMMITALFVFDQPLDFERLKTTLEYGFMPFDRFRQRVVEPRFGLGSPHWETDSNFDIASHVHRIALPAPGDQAALQAVVSDLMSTPLDFSKPLWQYHLIENYGEGCAVLARLHHCIADGIALVKVLLSMTDTEPDAPWPTLPTKEEHRRGWNPLRVIMRPAAAAMGATRRVTGTLLSESVEVLTNPGHALELARMGADTALALGKLVLLPPDPKTIFKGELGIAKRAAWSQSIALDDIKAIKNTTGATVNDVLLAAVAGALRRYLQGRQQLVDGLNFRAFIPVNLRPEERTIELGNRFGLVFLSLPVGVADPIDRLLELKRRMDEIKGTPEAVVAFGILNAVGMAPAEIENVVVNIFGTKATAVMTNVPGPRQQLYFAGHPIKQFMFWVPQSGRVGLGVSILSYNNQVWLGVATDAGLAPDPETIVDAFHQEIDDLLALVAQVQEVDEAEAPAAPAEATPAAERSDDLTRIKGIGPTYAGRLQAAGVATFAALAASSAAALEAICQSRRPNYAGWIEQAAALAEG